MDGIIVQRLRFYVEQLGNETRLSTIRTSYQGNGRVINLVTSIQVIVSKVSHSQSSTALVPFHLTHLLSLPSLHARIIRGTKPLVDYSKSHVVIAILKDYANESYTERSFRTYHRGQKKGERRTKGHESN